MIEDPSYCSFLVRLWCERRDGADRWRGEVEHIQSGAVYEVSSLTEVFSLIGWAVAPGREHPTESEGGTMFRVKGGENQ